MGHLRGLGDCPLAFGDNPEGLCGWDGKPMPKGRRRWCSEACSLAWGDQHYWTQARPAAVKRDGGRCVVCGRSPVDPVRQLHLLAAILRPFDADWAQQLNEARVDAARYVRPDRVEKTAWALAWDRLYLSPAWKAYRADHELEVNHIEPRHGRGYQAGCWNHQANLETLCHRCHVAVTRLQRAGVHGPAVTLLGHRAVPAAMF
jgi:hypothetical protein